MSIQTVPFTAGAQGDNVVISGDPDKPSILIYGIFFKVSAACAVTLKASTDVLTGPMEFVTGDELNLPLNVNGPYFQCMDGKNLVITLSALSSLGGFITYDQF